MNILTKPVIKDEGYYFDFPLSITGEIVNFEGGVEKIKKYLEWRNIFYFSFNRRRKRLLIDRISSLSPLPEFVLDYMACEMPTKKIINIFVNGSYLYGDIGYVPGDIDVGTIVEGCAFDHIVDKIKIPSQLHKKLAVPVENICLSIYGEENMSNGIPIEDTFYDATLPSVIHKETTLRELSVAYWRDVVIWGKDFNYLENNERNILVTLGRMIADCYTRLLYRDNRKKDKKTRFRKIVTRAIETNLFLKYLYPNLQIDLDYLFKLPSKVLYENVPDDEMEKLCNSTLTAFKEVKKMCKSDKNLKSDRKLQKGNSFKKKEEIDKFMQTTGGK